MHIQEFILCYLTIEVKPDMQMIAQFISDHSILSE
jgi:hypothetical protein